ncbi:MAG: NADH-quinone oxidoreductase subunit J [Candidatus Poribacteria bacterium]|jgi:NADH-quinone oxidoreductase subunit J|nr:NADH-quinone oxidoreductase subunit J [Candidatus Poribacteria bacterium]
MVLLVIFGLVAICSAICVVAFKNPIHSALALILTFFSQAGLFIALGAHFVAAVQVIVYAGAIMVLFLFVIMLLNLGSLQDTARQNISAIKIFVLVLAVLLAIEGITVARYVDQNGGVIKKQSTDVIIQRLKDDFKMSDEDIKHSVEELYGKGTSVSNLTSVQVTGLVHGEMGKTERIGTLLFSKFVLPFEVTSFILIAALIGVIAIVNREPQEAA